jgi:hypothetical protein
MAKPAKKAKLRTGKKTPAGGKKSAKRAAAKPRGGSGSHVSFGLHGIRKIMGKVRSAGLESEFNKNMGDDHQFVQIHRSTLQKIKKFAASRPELADLHQEMDECDCPPDDPYCIWI